MTRFRRRLLLSGFAGLMANAALAALAAWLIGSEIVQAPLLHPLVTVIAAAALGGLSLAEMPMMVLAIRHLAAERPNNQAFALGLNTTFIFFAAVYGVPVLLLTGDLGWGLALCALGLARLAASLLFVHEPPALSK
jgi:MFS family permease